jgi:DNA-binding LacI/PurR family transcriptional regulator
MSDKSRVSERVQKYRAALRAAGLRPVQIWVPDTRRRGFAAECRRQSCSLRGDAAEGETIDWLDQVADRDGWSP